MISVAEKFKSIGKVTKNTNTSSAIFGSAGDLAQSIDNVVSIRVGFYPIISTVEPELAMGLASCLSYLLVQYNNVNVYRVFAKIDSDDDEELNIEDSQFTPDDWEFEGLDDNVLISGRIIQNDDTTNSLHLVIDQSLIDETVEDIELTYTYTSLHEIVNQLPHITEEIISYIKPETEEPSTELIITYDPLKQQPDNLKEILETVFYWNLDLYLYVWGVEWNDGDIEAQFDEMLSICTRDNHEFGTWCASMMARQVMQVGLDAIGDVLVPLMDRVFTLDANSVIPTLILSKGLTDLGYIEEAVSLIAEHTTDATKDVRVWLAQVEVYMQAGRYTQAIDVNQHAIELGIQDVKLYWSYIRLLILAEANDWFVEQLLLVDPDEVDEEEQITQEIIQSLERLLELDPDDLKALYTLLSYLIQEQKEDVWLYFGRLVEMDTASLYIRTVIDRFYELFDLKPAFDILNTQLEKNKDNPHAYLNLAQLAIVDENMALAQEYLNKCKQLISDDDQSIELEIQALLLNATYPDFDHRLSEMKIVLDTKGTVPESDVEFLEEAIEIAPKFGDLYVTLGRCYLGWKDIDIALEVLTEAQRNVGHHPRIIEVLAQSLWDKGDKELAFNHLNEGLQQYPNDLPLLIQIAGYLIDNDQLDDAKPFIERAEIIAPSYPGLWALRKRVADKYIG